ncbi:MULTISPECIES: TrkH family potassium uptake protein [unclassified Paenibacillus]|uniref:TrkH family potassium uptake protein n=1 Tax=unclassified Paenibacillus TaxID=185978 RepID=UPI002406E864|nr:MULTISPECIES: TrkH family potassium uptake protein [unclassified Paenibacillus]MDF9841200.1 trk system potassium uptake protein TrkH [Paenibacillus sp. PastF-2]MDF9847628.1 trk system potassium uptake protein TrkH [Paenibacillus sp. PastM-2]MDF9854197.1 trk system potassium uptake protein TrkH [Paenibacillus sp. PastF-1]MDH6479632.1 trk system potassium uptake protein TrkH [Paenibacillus sp. PastH-2]MDH6505297.1 trk system potassium uptake protein TrkH [Paenibacillus sp. PastM-3]
MANISLGHLRLTPPKILSLGFVLLIAVGTLLLCLPAASTSGRISFIDALFMATSATCVTGLAVIDTGTQLTVFGQIVLLVLFQFGGLGFVTMATLITLVLNKRISLKERLLLQESMNQNSMQGIVKLIRRVLIYSLVIQLIGAMLFTVRFIMDMPAGKAVYYGLFHSVSIFNNAGFDLFGDVHGPFSGLTRYVEDPIVNITSMLLIFLGGIGFIVLSDIVDFRKRKRLTLHSKVVLSTSAVLILIGAAVFFWLELNTTLKPLHAGGKLMASFLQAITPRSGGVTTIEIPLLRESTQFLMILLMFIGAAPGSTGGGIKITTFAILVVTAYSKIRGKEDIVMFRHRISKDNVYRAITMTLLSLMLILIATMLLSVTESADFLTVLFEAVSAFGTSGITMGLTPELTTPGKILVIILMFVGRTGPLTLAYAIKPKKNKELFRYPEGNITIG